MTGLQILIVLALMGAVVGGWLVYSRRQKRKLRIALLTEGVDVLAHWAYTPDEWHRAVEEEFTWASAKDEVGEVYISPAMLYVKAANRDRLIELAGKGKVVTHASYRGADESPLKLRVRWKEVIRRHDPQREETYYYKEDYRIPVPSGAKESARQVVEFFTAELERNPDANASLVDDDEVISVFGTDAF